MYTLRNILNYITNENVFSEKIEYIDEPIEISEKKNINVDGQKNKFIKNYLTKN